MACAVLLSISAAQAQTATINWTNVHQIIDGFGATAPFIGDGNKNLTSAEQSFFFGTGAGELELSILRVGITDGNSLPGDCTSVSVSCAGDNVPDMQAAVAAGAKIYASPWSPPAAYKTNGSVTCTAGSGSGALATADYGLYATWLANFVQSLKTEENIPLYAMTIQNEPDQCVSYDGAVYTSAQIDTFIKSNLGPTFASAGISTMIFTPEDGGYQGITGAHGGGTCLTDAACYNYVGGINWHDYDATANSSDSISSATNPWPSLGKKYWETEVSCGIGYGPSGCESGFNTDMTTDGLMWAGLIDDRLVNANVNAYLYWALLAGTSDDEGLETTSGTIPKRAYVFGQYSRFVRPNYYRIDATHIPQTGVSVSAYQYTATGTLVIVATNYSGSSISQTFSLENSPLFSTLTPYTTSTNLSLAAQASVTVANNSFTYSLPAGSVTTFVGTSTTVAPPTNLKGVPH
jgi:glucuronoarabinoxylan endo-1,4-beta-xylanase